MEKPEELQATADELTELLHTWLNAALIHTSEIRKHFIKTSGLSMPQVTLLMLLHHRGLSGLHEIAERMDFTSPAASQLVDKLVQAGLVERRESPDDRRAREVALSEKGQRIVGNLGDEFAHFLRNLVRVMSPEERDVVRHAVPILITAEKKLSRSMHPEGHETHYFSPKND